MRYRRSAAPLLEEILVAGGRNSRPGARRSEPSSKDTGFSRYENAVRIRSPFSDSLAYPSGNYKPFNDLVTATPEVIEAHHVTGADCFIIKVLARSMRDLERITGRLATLGGITTSVVYSSPVPSRHITPA